MSTVCMSSQILPPIACSVVQTTTSPICGKSSMGTEKETGGSCSDLTIVDQNGTSWSWYHKPTIQKTGAVLPSSKSRSRVPVA